MSLLSRLFGTNDPTRGWPPATEAVPEVSVERRALSSFAGSITFGDPLDAAKFLGRPDRYRGGPHSATLVYDRHDLVLEFEQNRFVGLSFSFEHDEGETPTDTLPRQRKGPDGLGLTPSTTRAEIVERFGQPTRLQEFDDETVLYYTKGGLVSEFQLDAKGRLTWWEVYLD
jgi:hypothetical protein